MNSCIDRRWYWCSALCVTYQRLIHAPHGAYMLSALFRPVIPVSKNDPLIFIEQKLSMFYTCNWKAVTDTAVHSLKVICRSSLVEKKGNTGARIWSYHLMGKGVRYLTKILCLTIPIVMTASWVLVNAFIDFRVHWCYGITTVYNNSNSTSTVWLFVEKLCFLAL